ncbi:MAG: TlpA family protein disulfide reductase [Deltaproteobacteria bacterium]|nr:TlpA family protein disulfide reductase [Deltaproteobacteria bacterium]
MKVRIFLQILLLSVLGAGLWWLFQQGPQGSSSAIQEGKTAPDFDLKDHEGHAVQLSQFRPKVVLLNFWATTCPPCVSEMASLEKLYQSFPRDEFEILGVSMDEEGWTPIEEFKKLHLVSFKIVLDAEFKVADLYSVDHIPQTYLIDQKGTVVEETLGAQDWSEAAVIQKIKNLIQKR